MGQVNTLAFIISVGFFFLLLTEIIRSFKIKSIKKTPLIVFILLFILEVVIFAWQIIPQIRSDAVFFSIAGATTRFYDSFSVNEFLTQLSGNSIRAFIPIPPFTIEFWNNNLIINFLQQSYLLYQLLIFLIIFTITILMLKRTIVYFYFFIGIILSIGFIFYNNNSRIVGYLFIFFIACLWISNNIGKDRFLINLKPSFNKKFQNISLIIILLPAIIGSSVAFYYDYNYPFSNGKNVAEYIKENFDKDNIIIIGYQDITTETVSGYLNKDIYYPNSKDIKKLVKWDDRLGVVSNEDIFNPIISFFGSTNKVLVILSELQEEVDIPFLYHLIDIKYDNAIVSSENFSLYLFDKNKFFNIIKSTNYQNFNDYWRHLERCEFIVEDDKVRLKVNGDDPHFESNFNINFDMDDLIVLKAKLYSYEDTYFQVYYKRESSGYSENDSSKLELKTGMNEIYIIVPKPYDIVSLRVDPVLNKSDCIIEKLEILEVIN
jgi:hypothetical protein